MNPRIDIGNGSEDIEARQIRAAAHESITACTPVSDRSQEAARSAVAVAQALFGSGETKSFGWHRRQDRERLSIEEIRLLKAACGPFVPPVVQIGSQGEHDVFYDGRASHVFKITNNSAFGYGVDQENDNRANKLCLRKALASEYLMRLGVHNVAFGDEVRLRAIGRDAHDFPTFVTAQPYADVQTPTQAEINELLEDFGFVRLPEEMLVQSMHSHGIWWRAEDQLLATDANPENFSKLGATVIVPIDLIIHPFPSSLIAATALQNGVRCG